MHSKHLAKLMQGKLEEEAAGVKKRKQALMD